MRARSVLFALVFFSAMAATAAPRPASAADWADRMIASRPPANQAGPDWADRMAARMGPGASPSRDWVERLIAGRSAEFAPGSLVQIERVQAALVGAGSAKDLGRILSLFARDATVTSNGRTYAGIDAIRTYWENAGPFLAQNHWEGYTPTQEVRINAASDNATLQFECLWVDTATGQVRARSHASGILVKDGNQWVITRMSAG